MEFKPNINVVSTTQNKNPINSNSTFQLILDVILQSDFLVYPKFEPIKSNITETDFKIFIYTCTSVKSINMKVKNACAINGT